MEHSPPSPDAPPDAPPEWGIAARARRRLWRWPLVALGLVCAGLIGAAGSFAVSGRALPVPIWAIAQLEARLNSDIRASLPDTQLAIDAIGLSFGADFAPTLVLSGAKLRNSAGAPIMALPKAEVQLSPRSVLGGDLQLRAVSLSGANIAATRDMNGHLDIVFGNGAQFDPAQIFALADTFFNSPLGRDLQQISIADMELSLTDLRAAQTWSLRDGALNITHREGVLAADLGLSLAAQTIGGAPAGLGRVDISLTSAVGQASANVSARLSGVSAQDLAAQSPPLAFMAVLDAPISGQVSSTLTPQGLTALQANLTLGAGALAPFGAEVAAGDGPAPRPINFQSASLDLAYDSATGRLTLGQLLVQSDVVQLRARGYADALRADGSVIAGQLAGEWPAAFAAQLQLAQLVVAQDDMFDAPVEFAAGHADITLRLAPFSVDVTSAALTGQAGTIEGRGQVLARPEGWQTSLQVNAPALSAQQLLALWPKTMVKGTRVWLSDNLQAANFTDIALSLRKGANAPAQLELGYHFTDMTLTPMRTLPPISEGAGYGAIAGNSFSIALTQGRTTPPQGGALDLAGSVFSIPDTRVFPATGKLTLQSNGALAATLSLIDQPPFGYVSKAGQKPDFASGAAQLTAQISLPLQKVIAPGDVTLQVTGKISDFASDQLVEGRRITAPALDVFVTSQGLRLRGAGEISGIPFEGDYTQAFAQGAAPRIAGLARLDDASLRAFGVALPNGMVGGQGRAEFEITLPRGQAGQMVLTSDLRGIDLAIPAIGYRKAGDADGQLRAEISLSSPPQISLLAIRAADLAASGTLRLGARGALIAASFPDTTIGKWFAGDVVFTAPAGALALSVPRGTIDMRFLPQSRQGGAGGAGLPISLRLDRLRITNGLTLTGFAGDFRTETGGLRGNFAAQVAQGAAIQGQLSPSAHGTQIRVTSQNAGAAMAQAGLYGAARGGQLDMVLTPQPTAGHYLGLVEMAGVRVQSSSALAELLNAISVVGLLDQLGGPGILFNAVSGQFLLTPSGIELREGVATGASLGVTMQGIYQFASSQLQMQGVISPIYLINGLGAAVSNRGEGVLGFNYRLRGTADAPQVRVNPLSVLLPGFLRNIFKPPPATLE